MEPIMTSGCWKYISDTEFTHYISFYKRDRPIRWVFKGVINSWNKRKDLNVIKLRLSDSSIAPSSGFPHFFSDLCNALWHRSTSRPRVQETSISPCPCTYYTIWMPFRDASQAQSCAPQIPENSLFMDFIIIIMEVPTIIVQTLKKLKNLIKSIVLYVFRHPIYRGFLILLFALTLGSLSQEFIRSLYKRFIEWRNSRNTKSEKKDITNAKNRHRSNSTSSSDRRG